MVCVNSPENCTRAENGWKVMDFFSWRYILFSVKFYFDFVAMLGETHRKMKFIYEISKKPVLENKKGEKFFLHLFATS